MKTPLKTEQPFLYLTSNTGILLSFFSWGEKKKENKFYMDMSLI